MIFCVAKIFTQDFILNNNVAKQLILFSVTLLVLAKQVNVKEYNVLKNWPVDLAVTRSSLEREVKGSNLGPVKSDTVLPTVRHRCNTFSDGAVFAADAMTQR